MKKQYIVGLGIVGILGIGLLILSMLGIISLFSIVDNRPTIPLPHHSITDIAGHEVEVKNLNWKPIIEGRRIYEPIFYYSINNVDFSGQNIYNIPKSNLQIEVINNGGSSFSTSGSSDGTFCKVLYNANNDKTTANYGDGCEGDSKLLAKVSFQDEFFFEVLSDGIRMEKTDDVPGMIILKKTFSTEVFNITFSSEKKEYKFDMPEGEFKVTGAYIIDGQKINFPKEIKVSNFKSQTENNDLVTAVFSKEEKNNLGRNFLAFMIIAICSLVFIVFVGSVFVSIVKEYWK